MRANRRAATLSHKGRGEGSKKRMIMRLAGIFILAIIASVLAGGGAIAAVSFLPDWNNAAGPGYDDAFRVLSTMAYVTFEQRLILYGMAIRCWQQQPPIAKMTARALAIYQSADFAFDCLSGNSAEWRSDDQLVSRRDRPDPDVRAVVDHRAGTVVDSSSLSVSADIARGSRMSIRTRWPLMKNLHLSVLE